jgi:hypothetical protein
MASDEPGAVQTKHRIALNRSFINEPYDAL